MTPGQGVFVKRELIDGVVCDKWMKKGWVQPGDVYEVYYESSDLRKVRKTKYTFGGEVEVRYYQDYDFGTPSEKVFAKPAVCDGEPCN